MLTLGSINLIMFDPVEYVNARQGLGAWILGGLLVGWGTRMGNGCTSGHGVCGLPRFAPRSFAAVATFMGAGFAMATFRYYVPFFTGSLSSDETLKDVWRWVALGLFILGSAGAAFVIVASGPKRTEMVVSYGLGLLFGVGLVVSGMCRISKIQGFLIIGEPWDPSLIFVMMSAVLINVFTFNYILTKVPRPVLSGAEGKYVVPPRGQIDSRLVIGAALFGLGWGLSGLCPGPGVICFFSLTNAIVWVASLAVGQVAFDIALEKYTKAHEKKA